MGKRHARHGRSRRAITDGDAPSCFDVLIGPSGTAALEGEPVPVPEGQAVHVAVLDMLQGFAEAQDAPVEAAVTDQRGGYSVRIQVDPDGASRLVGQDLAGQDDGQQALEPGHGHAAAAGSAHAAPPASAGGPAHSLQRVPPAGPRFDQTVKLDLTSIRPKKPDASAAPAAALTPEELDEAFAFINDALTAGDMERATVLNSRLREHTVKSHGEEHPYTLRTQEIESHIAHLRGDQQRATALSLSVARVRQRQGDPGARDALTRAATCWWMLSDARATLNYGSELMTLWTQLIQSGNGGTGDSELLDRIRQHMGTVSKNARRG